jgi:hypothetical protein
MIQFIGREEYLGTLWKWLCDPYWPVKILSGLGGVGKTTIARKFAEIVASNSPLALEQVVWLSAKQQFFIPLSNTYESITRVDFTDLPSILRALLRELGLPPEQIEADASREELIEEVVNALSLYPSLVIVDDVDSLEVDQQQDVFQTMIQIMSRTLSQKYVPSRALLTSRLQLGAAPAQLIKVEGLINSEFNEYVTITAKSLGIPVNLSKAQLTKFHAASSGSPTFASSILRLMQTGESFNSAIERWKGVEGQKVRCFAFERELSRLTSSQIRTLFAMCVLGITSFLELTQILDCAESRLSDDLSELRKYHLYAATGVVREGGAHLEVPSSIRLMQETIRGRTNDPSRIEHECAIARKQTAQLNVDIGIMINRVIALWRDNKHEEALSVAKFLSSKYPKNPDIFCLLGRTYMRIIPPDTAKADITFTQANKLGCERPELFTLWIDCKTQRKDWHGLIYVTRLADQKSPSEDNAIARSKAFISLAQATVESGFIDKAAKIYLEGGRDANQVIKAKKLGPTAFVELNSSRAEMMFNYVRLADRRYSLPGDHIYVWLAFLEAFACFVRRPLLVRTGISRLCSWWEAVYHRAHYDNKAFELMKVQLGNLDSVIQSLQSQDFPDMELLKEVTLTKTMLDSSWNNYRRENEN